MVCGYDGPGYLNQNSSRKVSTYKDGCLVVFCFVLFLWFFFSDIWR